MNVRGNLIYYKYPFPHSGLTIQSCSKLQFVMYCQSVSSIFSHVMSIPRVVILGASNQKRIFSTICLLNFKKPVGSPFHMIFFVTLLHIISQQISAEKHRGKLEKYSIQSWFSQIIVIIGISYIFRLPMFLFNLDVSI